MEVYIEYVVIDNLVMDYLLLKFTAKLLKIEYKRFMLFIGAAIGTLGAVFIPMLVLPQNLLFLIKIALGMLVCFVGVNHKSAFLYFKFFNVFLLLTFMLGGAIVGILSIMGVEYTAQGYKAQGLLPVGVNLIVAYVFGFLVKKLAEKSYRFIITRRFVYKCRLYKNGACINLDGYLDSGNNLFDKKSGKPVALCDERLIKKLTDKGATFTPPRKLILSTVSSQKEINLYDVDYLIIDCNGQEKKCDLVLGTVENKTFNEDLLLGAMMGI